MAHSNPQQPLALVDILLKFYSEQTCCEQCQQISPTSTGLCLQLNLPPPFTEISRCVHHNEIQSSKAPETSVLGTARS